MDLPLFIRRRLEELRVEQKDLATAAHVTESYISQLLGRKKAPPAPNRTAIYRKMERFLRIPRGELARLAYLDRREELKKELMRKGEPVYEAVAYKGIGVFDTLKAVAKQVLVELKKGSGG